MTVTMHMANTGSKAVTKTETVPSLASASSRSKKADSVSCKRAIEMFSAKKNNCDNFLPPPSFPFPSGKFCDWGVNLRTKPKKPKTSSSKMCVRPLPFNNSWKSENRVSKSKIEFPALASI